MLTLYFAEKSLMSGREGGVGETVLWHWRSRPVDGVGNVANVVTECHRAPSWSIETLQVVDGGRWRGRRKRMLGDISSLGTTKEEQEVDGSRTGWLSFACRCNDVAAALASTRKIGVYLWRQSFRQRLSPTGVFFLVNKTLYSPL